MIVRLGGHVVLPCADEDIERPLRHGVIVGAQLGHREQHPILLGGRERAGVAARRSELHAIRTLLEVDRLQKRHQPVRE